MNLNYKNIKILKDINKRKFFLKKELKFFFFKQLIRNQNIQPKIRMFAQICSITKKKKKYSLTIQENRCLLTSKAKTTFKLTSLSRHHTKKLADLGLFQNLKAESY